VITVAIPASAVHKQCVARADSTREGCGNCGLSNSFPLDALIAHDSRNGRDYGMNGFLKATFTRQKFQGLFVNTAVGNFAAYVTGSLVTLASTRQVFEQRGIRNLFGLLPRKKIVLHMMPHWLEWLLALIVGFLVMEAVRYCFNHLRYAQLLTALRRDRQTETGGQACDQPRYVKVFHEEAQ
jgi:hypothetical protein